MNEVSYLSVKCSNSSIQKGLLREPHTRQKKLDGVESVVRFCVGAPRVEWKFAKQPPHTFVDLWTDSGHCKLPANAQAVVAMS